MIKKIIIKNFRNIKNLELDFKKANLIIGQNGIGKSNALNAVNWLITNKLFTDKYGDGESDIASIVPNHIRKSEFTEVSIILDNDKIFTKSYIRSYDKVSGKILKHSTEYYINHEQITTQTEFYNQLYSQFNFTPKFTKLKIEEVRLFTDPLYALLKLDYKELRKLLVAMGCTVTNEELFNLGFADLKQYESKYDGKWDVMRKQIKDELKSLGEDISRVENQLEMYNGIEEPNPEVLKELQDEKSSLITKLNDLKNLGCKDIISGIENDIRNKTTELNEKRSKMKIELQAKISDLQNEKHNLSSQVEKSKFEALKPILEHISKTREVLMNKKIELSDKNLKIGKLESEIKVNELKLQNMETLKQESSHKLAHILDTNEGDLIVCPVCGSEFDFNKGNKELEKAKLIDTLNQVDLDIENTEKEIESLKAQIESASVDKKTLEEIVSSTQKQLDQANADKTSTESNFSIDNKSIEIDTQILELEKKVLNINEFFIEESKEINDLIEKKTNIILDNQQAANLEIDAVNSQIVNVDEKIREEYIKSNDYDIAQELEKGLEYMAKEYNDKEFLLTQVNGIIKAMCQLINSKAKEITGFDFVLLEQNLSNDGITETCYCVDENGIPFKDLNSAKKIEMGIKFIESVKKLNNNNLPILADKLEGIDFVSKIFTMTENQIIGTRVDTNEKIEVITENEILY